MHYKTEQEEFWAGDFGSDYISRNSSQQLLYAKVALWARMLKACHSVGSVCELGCNIGLNLLALKHLKPSLTLTGYEINPEGVRQAQNLKVAEIRQQSIIEPLSASPADLSFTVGVLIHINPEFLAAVYDNLVRLSRRYVLVAEYFNPSPTSVPYRGHSERLFKRDFADDLIKAHGLHLVDYGFVYKQDNWAPHDDINWFLLER